MFKNIDLVELGFAVMLGSASTMILAFAFLMVRFALGDVCIVE